MAFETTTDFRDFHFTAEDGLRLHGRDYPPAGTGTPRLPLVCLPGLSRNARDFHLFARHAAQHPTAARRVVALDYRGRGGSDRDANPANYNVGVECRDVVSACAALGLERSIFVGTSRGGLILHVMAATRPDLIAAAVLNDIGPEIESAGLAEIRDYLSRPSEASSYDEAADNLARLHGAAFPALARADWLDMAQALNTERDGKIVPDFDAALVAPFHAIDYSKPLPTLWPQFALLAKTPLLAIRGEHSRLLSPAVLARMAEGGARTVIAPGQGHAPLLHHPGILPAALAFLETV